MRHTFTRQSSISLPVEKRHPVQLLKRQRSIYSIIGETFILFFRHRAHSFNTQLFTISLFYLNRLYCMLVQWLALLDHGKKVLS